MKIVILDGYTENPGDLSWGELEKLGEVTVYDRTSYVDDPIIAERIGDGEYRLSETAWTKNGRTGKDWFYCQTIISRRSNALPEKIS